MNPYLLQVPEHEPSFRRLTTINIQIRLSLRYLAIKFVF